MKFLFIDPNRLSH